MYIYNKNKGKPIVHVSIKGGPLCAVHVGRKYIESVESPKNGKPCKNCEKHLKDGTRPKRRVKKVSDVKFYASWEWRELRYKVLKKYGSTCMCCGAKAPDVKVVVDHIKPRSKFPELELKFSNLQVLCDSCNMGKSNKDYTDFRS